MREVRWERLLNPALSIERFVREGPQKRFIEPRLLYLIKQSPGYGYQLTEDIGKLPFPGPTPDSAAVYRTLRDLEKEGLVRSEGSTARQARPSASTAHAARGDAAAGLGGGHQGEGQDAQRIHRAVRAAE